jgi:hypothetical protein
MEISGSELRGGEWVVVEMGVKVVKLQGALGTAPLDISGPARL